MEAIIILQKNKLRILNTILIIIFLIGIPNQYGTGNHFLAVLGSICIVLLICIQLFQINKFRSVVLIFISIFLIGQAVGYGLSIDFLRIYSSINNGRGSSYSLASTVIPIILTFIIDFMYKAFNKRALNK